MQLISNFLYRKWQRLLVDLIHFLICDFIENLAKFVPVLVAIQSSFYQILVLAAGVLFIALLTEFLCDKSVYGVYLVVVDHLFRAHSIFFQVASNKPLLVVLHFFVFLFESSWDFFILSRQIPFWIDNFYWSTTNSLSRMNFLIMARDHLLCIVWTISLDHVSKLCLNLRTNLISFFNSLLLRDYTDEAWSTFSDLWGRTWGSFSF